MNINLTLKIYDNHLEEKYLSILPDFESKGRSSVKMEFNKELKFIIEGNDYTAIRASINSILLKLRVMKNLEDDLDGKSK